MFEQIFSTIGGFIGKNFGGRISSTIGKMTGKNLGKYLDHDMFEPAEYQHYSKILDNLYISASTRGNIIPIVFYNSKVSGSIIWAMEIEEVENLTDQEFLSSSGTTRSIHHYTEYKYFASFALGLCQGEIDNIGIVWANNKLIDISQYQYNLYLGSETQMPDQIISKNMGDTPAFRGLAYIVFDRLPLEDFANKIPNFSFEVFRKPKLPSRLEELIKSMIILPGSGEFVYDTVIQKKYIKDSDDILISSEVINCHNESKIANSVYSFDKLKKTCKNLSWVAPVVCWFSNSLNARDAKIMPAVEFNDQYTSTSEDWNVANTNRQSAYLIGRDKYQSPRYGGTINDASLLRYLDFLKEKNIKIMLYPVFLVDLPDKPWRGHMTGSDEDIKNFFTKKDGYNNYILHYANLVKGKVDAFVIGSELIGLTKVKAADNSFPAVEALVVLSRQVKAILGSNVIVTYASDWSEYHHTDNGWYNLDPLWASPDIDVVGIDAYFPITESCSSNISLDDIKAGWKKGEGYDYYLDSNQKKHPLDPKYAWKNIQYWWENYHQNPDGNATNWQPKMKKIWFTEFGFPSIDKATNQPNVFFDPYCRDGGIPRYSSGDTDFAIQRKAIKASLQVFENSEFLDQMFLWCWDVRPYPAWPYLNIWRDSHLWEKGHSVNNKLSSCNLGSILLELCLRCDIDLDNVLIQDLEECELEGLVIDNNLRAIDIIDLLRFSYFFDIIYQDGNLIFKGRNTHNIKELNSSDFIKLNKKDSISIITLSDNQLLSKICLSFLDISKNYHYNSVINNNLHENSKTRTLKLPISNHENNAKKIANEIIERSQSENKIFRFFLPFIFYRLQIGSVCLLKIETREYLARITNFKIHKLIIEVEAVVEIIR